MNRALLVILSALALAGCSAAVPAPAASPQVVTTPQPVYVSVTVTRGCAKGSVSVSVTHVDAGILLLVRADITHALRSAVADRLAKAAGCGGTP